MRLPNGYGSIYKLKGKRRRPYRVMITKGYEITSENKSKQIRVTLGYYETKPLAMEALINYNNNPYDIAVETITFKEVYKKWSEEHFKTYKSDSSARSYIAAFKHSKPIHNVRFKDLRPNHLEGTIKDAKCGDATKSRMKSLYNLMFRYALKHDIVNKNYADLCNGVKVKSTRVKVPFSIEEVSKLWKHVKDIPFVDMIIVGLYTGFRPQELVLLETKNIDLTEGMIVEGMKTSAGTDRLVPIHPEIRTIIEELYNEDNQFLFVDYNMFTKRIDPLTYDKYRGRFKKVMSALEMKHSPHETRHSFITQAKECDMNEYILKRIVGHEIRDITENVYTHRDKNKLKEEMAKVIF